MIEASSVTSPSVSGSPPQPTLSTDASSSQWVIPASTASSEGAPVESTSHATSLAAIPKGQVETTTGTCSLCVAFIEIFQTYKIRRRDAEDAEEENAECLMLNAESENHALLIQHSALSIQHFSFLHCVLCVSVVNPHFCGRNRSRGQEVIQTFPRKKPAT